MHVRRLLAAALVAATLVGPAEAFTPAKYLGTWSGSWKNTTFRSSAPFNATVTSPDGTSLAIAYTVDRLFNCAGTTHTRTLVSGVDFTARGLGFQSQHPDWGTATIRSRRVGGVEKIKASGTSPCNLSVQKWSLTASLTPRKLKGKMKITFVQGSPKTAMDTFSATKQ
jgi:hypothetical protein